MSIKATFTAIQEQDDKGPGEKLHEATKALQLEQPGTTYSAAFARAAEAMPETHREYLLSNGTNRRVSDA